MSLFQHLLFWIWHASRLSTAIQSVKTLDQLEVLMTSWLTNFYIYVFILIVGLAFFLPEDWPVKYANPARVGAVIAPLALVLGLVLINYTNLRIIHADIVFKMADPYNKTGLWPNATRLYKEAIKLAPDEDYYYLFLGRSYLEQAKEEKEPDQLIIEAEVLRIFSNLAKVKVLARVGEETAAEGTLVLAKGPNSTL